MTRGCNEQTVMLANGNFEILLKAHNFSFHQPGKDYFAISVLINTQVPTSMNFVDIQLQFLNNQRKSPEGFMIRKIGPEKSLPSHFCMGDSYYSRGEIRRYPFYYKVDNTRYQISPGTCYDLFFSGPPPVPGEVFYLNLQSVIHGEKTLRLPSIRFE